MTDESLVGTYDINSLPNSIMVDQYRYVEHKKERLHINCGTTI